MGGLRGRVSLWWVAEFSSLVEKEGRPKEGPLRKGWGGVTSSEGSQELSQGSKGFGGQLGSAKDRPLCRLREVLFGARPWVGRGEVLPEVGRGDQRKWLGLNWPCA